MRKSIIVGIIVAAVALMLASIVGTANASESPNNRGTMICDACD